MFPTTNCWLCSLVVDVFGSNEKKMWCVVQAVLRGEVSRFIVEVEFYTRKNSAGKSQGTWGLVPIGFVSCEIISFFALLKPTALQVYCLLLLAFSWFPSFLCLRMWLWTRWGDSVIWLSTWNWDNVISLMRTKNLNFPPKNRFEQAKTFFRVIGKIERDI